MGRRPALDGNWSQRSLTVTEQRIGDFQVALLLGEPPPGFEPDETALEIDAASIDALASRSGDTFIWHMEPGAVYRESSLMGVRMSHGRIDQNSRLAHGLSSVILALRTSHQQQPDAPISGFSNVRYTTPVFEGATLAVQVEPLAGSSSGFVVTTNQLQPDLATTGRIHYGAVAEAHDAAFSSLAEQQLYSLEEIAGMISAVIGLGAQADGMRALLMGQRLELTDLLVIGDKLEAAAEITARTPGRSGERVTATLGVFRQGSGGGLVAVGEATFLIVPPVEHA